VSARKLADAKLPMALANLEKDSVTPLAQAFLRTI
jgi:hypothetical protein